MWNKIKEIASNSVKDFLSLFSGLLKIIFFIIIILFVFIAMSWPCVFIALLSHYYSPYYMFLLIGWLFYFCFMKNIIDTMGMPQCLVDFMTWIC